MGVPGPIGAPGPMGIQGPTGLMGKVGKTGNTGNDGPVGDTGPMGPPGESGASGITSYSMNNAISDALIPYSTIDRMESFVLDHVSSSLSPYSTTMQIMETIPSLLTPYITLSTIGTILQTSLQSYPTIITTNELITNTFALCCTLSGNNIVHGTFHSMNNTPSTSPSTGSVVIHGGMGIMGTLFVGGNSSFLSPIDFNSSCTFHNNIIVTTLRKTIHPYIQPFIFPGQNSSPSTITFDYTKGSVFLLPTDFPFFSHFHCTIINVPLDTSTTYECTISYKQSSTNYYCTSISLYDSDNNILYGPSPVKFCTSTQITTYPVIVYQTFTILCFKNISGSLITREVLCTSMNIF
jgi:hypothetical protein